MRNKFGKICLFLGVLQLCCAMSLYLYNRNEDSQSTLR